MIAPQAPPHCWRPAPDETKPRHPASSTAVCRSEFISVESNNKTLELVLSVSDLIFPIPLYYTFIILLVYDKLGFKTKHRCPPTPTPPHPGQSEKHCFRGCGACPGVTVHDEIWNLGSGPTCSPPPGQHPNALFPHQSPSRLSATPPLLDSYHPPPSLFLPKLPQCFAWTPVILVHLFVWLALHMVCAPKVRKKKSRVWVGRGGEGSVCGHSNRKSKSRLFPDPT